MAKKSKAQIKKEQANMQSDNIEMGAWSTESMSSDGIQNTGDFTYSFADLDDDFDSLNVNTVSTGFTVVGLAFDNEKELVEISPKLMA